MIFTPDHKLFKTSKIIITPPSGITTTTCVYVSGGAAITSTPQCNKVATGWELTNIWANDGDFLGEIPISVSLGIGTNPISVQQAGGWSVTTYNQVGGQYYKVDTGTQATSFITLAGNITPKLLIPSSTTTNDLNAIYTF